MTDALDAAAMIRRNADRLLQTIEDMPGPQWLYRPAPTAWSVSQVVEHVAIANAGIAARVNGGLTTPLGGPCGVDDDEIPYLFYLGDEPPNVSKPTGDWTDIADATQQFASNADVLVDFARGTELDLRQYGAAHPIFGLFDGVQWLLFSGAHIERHRRQLIGYGLRPDFPAR